MQPTSEEIQAAAREARRPAKAAMRYVEGVEALKIETLRAHTVEDGARLGREVAILLNGRLARGEATGVYGADVMVNAFRRHARLLREHNSQEVADAFVWGFTNWSH